MTGHITRIGEADGLPIADIELVCASGARAKILSWGATLRDCQVPGPEGTLHRVVLGYDDLDCCIANPSSVGATCGRVANRSRRTGSTLEVWTTEPGLQLYDGSHLRPTLWPRRAGARH